MNLKTTLKENRGPGAIGAAITCLVGLLLLMSALGDGLSRLSFDFPFAFRSAPTNDDVRIIYMDEPSFARLGQPLDLWHRSLHAQLLSELTKRGAKAVVFDVLFDKPWLEMAGTNRSSADADLKQELTSKRLLNVKIVAPKDVDHQLGDAIRAASNVVLAASLYTQVGRIRVKQLRIPTTEIGEGFHWGVTEFPSDPGITPTIRRQYYDPTYPNLAWVVAEVLGVAPPERELPRYLNYYGGRDALPRASYYEVLEAGTLGSNYFSGKVVFVGMGRLTTTVGQNREDFATPCTRWGGDTTQGVEIQATAFLNLLHRDWLTEFSPLAEFTLLIGFGLLFGYGFILVRPWAAAGIGMIGIVVIATSALLLVWNKHIWFPWLIPAGVQIPLALGWTVLWNTRKLYHEKEVLEEKLATATSTPPRTSVPAQSQPELASASSDGPTRLTPTRPTVPPTELAPQIPDHELLRRIGKGGYGEVWLARDVIGSFHAVKIIYRKTFDNDGPFDREFKGIQNFTPISLSHPGFVHVLHVGRKPGYFYYIMEVGDDEVTGQKIEPGTYSPKNLAKEIAKRGKYPLDECLQLSLALTAALDYLHQQQLIHRDIKPSNIIFVNGVPKIADIGLVTNIASAGQDVTYLGTEGYIPPEGPGTAAGDVYSLGKLIYEASMGRNPGYYPDPPTTMAERPAEHREMYQLHEIILKACKPDVRVRYQTMAELRADLLRLQTQLEAQRVQASS